MIAHFSNIINRKMEYVNCMEGVCTQAEYYLKAQRLAVVKGSSTKGITPSSIGLLDLRVDRDTLAYKVELYLRTIKI